jgi:hypothetical protein
VVDGGVDIVSESGILLLGRVDGIEDRRGHMYYNRGALPGRDKVRQPAHLGSCIVRHSIRVCVLVVVYVILVLCVK